MIRRKDKAERIKRRSRAFMFVSGLAVFCGCSLWLAGCSSSAEERKPETELESARDIQDGTGLEDTLAVVNFDHELDGYEPLKKEYNFYFTYKMVHPWWDAVALGKHAELLVQKKRE